MRWLDGITDSMDINLAPNSSAARLAPRHEFRVSLIAEFSQ